MKQDDRLDRPILTRKRTPCRGEHHRKALNSKDFEMTNETIRQVAGLDVL